MTIAPQASKNYEKIGIKSNQISTEEDGLVELFKLNMIQQMNQYALAEKAREAETKSEREQEEKRYAICRWPNTKKKHEDTSK